MERRAGGGKDRESVGRRIEVNKLKQSNFLQ